MFLINVINILVNDKTIALGNKKAPEGAFKIGQENEGDLKLF
jgi:hypothetical protein